MVSRAFALGLVLLSCLLGAGTAGATSPGSLDQGFGSGGLVSLGAGTQLFGVAVQPDGQVVAAGQSGGRIFVQRFSAGGQPGAAYTGPAGYARAVALQADGKVIIGGTIGDAMFAQRLTGSLTPDTAFNHGSPATTLGGDSAVGYAVGVGPDGSVTVGGSVYSPTTRVGAAHFDASGHTQWSKIFDYGANSLVHGLVVQPGDGKIVLVGRQTPQQATNGLLIRLNSNGSIDYGFNGGAFTYHYPGGGYTELTSVALQPGGQIVAAGIGFANDANALFLRLNADGTYDKTFGSGGVSVLPSTMNVLAPGDPIGAYGVGIGGGGRIIGAGNFENTGADVDAALWALTPGGAPDAGFSGTGTSRGPTGNYEDCGMAIAPDGSIVTVGNTVSTHPDVAPCSIDAGAATFVARYGGFGPPSSSPSQPNNPTPAPPAVSTGGASHVSQISALVSGAVTPNGLATTYRVDYGTTSAYGSHTGDFPLGAGTAPAVVSAALKHLRPGTRYHYRLVAQSSAGTTYGSDASFTTLPPLSVALKALPKTFRLRALLSKGLSIRLSCNEACAIRGTMRVSAAAANHAGLGRRALSIATGSATLHRRGTGSITLRIDKRLRSVLARQRRLLVTLALSITPVGGGRSVSFRKPLTLTG